MKTDISRENFRADRNYDSVRLQQGRIITDADWNEQADIHNHLRENISRSVVGPTGAPRENAGFAVSAGSGDLNIGAGRMYVNGVPCELGAPENYLGQSDLPGAPAPAADGPYLVYLDVWKRAVTPLDAPDIREPALGGPNASFRSRILHQVKLLSLAGDTYDARSIPPEWTALLTSSHGRLNARTAADGLTADPCTIGARGGYNGADNRLYRVEIHRGGPAGTATFKWSRDNAAFAAEWSALDGGSVLTISNAGRDADQAFAAGDWIEITDEGLELEESPGTLARLTAVQGNSLTIDPDTLRHFDGAGGPNSPGGRALDPAEFQRGVRRVRRWDMVGAAGDIVTPAADVDPDAAWVELESGVQIRFDDDAGRTYRSGEYWLIPARVQNRNIEWPHDETGAGLFTEAFGPRHQYARLAFANSTAGTWSIIADARRIFPSLTDAKMQFAGGDGQSILPNAELDQPLCVRISSGEQPVPAARVSFRIASGGGDLVDATDAGNSGSTVLVRADASGLAAVRWTTGSDRNDQSVDAQLLDEDGSPVSGAVLKFFAHKGAAGVVEYTPPILTSPGGDDLMLGVETVQDGLDRLADIKVNKAGDTMTGPLTISSDLEVTGNFTVRGDVIARDTDHMPGDVLLGDQDEDTITIHGTLQSEHSSGALVIDDALRVHTTDGSDVPFEVRAPVSGLAGRTYRRPIGIDNGSGGALNDYQLLLTIDTAAIIAAGKMRADCGDVLFTDAAGVPLSYWLESGANTNATRFWVRVPSIGAAASETIYIYYGNPNATSQSSAQNTFIREIGGVQGAWKFEEGVGPNIVDYSGNGRNGTVQGMAPFWVSGGGPFYDAMNFNGTNHAVALPAGNLIGTGNDPFTTSFWFYPTQTVAGHGQYGFTRWSQDSQFLIGAFNLTGPTQLFWGFRGASHITLDWDDSAVLNTWMHFALIYNGGSKGSPGSYELYLNGVAQGGISTYSIVGGSCNNNGIGSDGPDAACNPQYFFPGRLSQVRAYNRALSPAEITDIVANYPYVTLARPGAELVRKFSANEPAINLQAEQNVAGTEQSIVFVESGSGNVGIGTNTPSEKLTVDGLVESRSGGFKFPDGSVQVTAGGGSGPGAGYDTMPLGTILAWHRDFDGTPNLPEGWVECNGQSIEDVLSPYNGLNAPDLNNARQSWNSRGSFLRGGTTSGEYEDDQIQGHWHSESAPGHNHREAGGIRADFQRNGTVEGQDVPRPDLPAINTSQTQVTVTDPVDDGTNGNPRTGDETRPVNMSVVWIIKIRPAGVGSGNTVFVQSNFQFIHWQPQVPNNSQTITETLTASNNWQNHDAPAQTFTMPTTGRCFFKADISYHNHTGGAIFIRAVIDGSLIGTITAYIPYEQPGDTGNTHTTNHPVMIGLGTEQDAVSAGEHTVEFQIYLSAPGDIFFDRSGAGHGLNNFQIYAYDLSAQNAGLWDANGNDVSRSSGNVGIGTDNPQAKLHIDGTPGIDGILFPDGSLQTTAGGAAGANLPLGTILAWHKSLTGTPPQLPDGWVECNGQTLSDPASPYDGQAIPDLNNPKETWNTKGAFLRGHTTSGEFEDDQYQGHHHRVYPGGGSDSGNTANTLAHDSNQGHYFGSTASYATGNGTIGWAVTQENDGSNGTPRTGAETLPANMSVVWIMKVREPAQLNVGGYALIEDRRPQGTNHGAGTPLAWNQRILNTLSTNINGLTLNSNRFTLPEGTYLIEGEFPVHRTGRNKVKLHDESNGLDVAYGTSTYAGGGVDDGMQATLRCIVATDGTKEYAIYHWLESTTGPQDFGVSTGAAGAEEIYASVRLLKLTPPGNTVASLADELVGTVSAFAGTTPPNGWLECDGTAISRTKYSRLYERIGDAYGSGDGSTTFNLPDLRGEFVRGWDNNRGVDSGRALGSTQDDAFQGHWHDLGENSDGTKVNFQGGSPISTGGGTVAPAIVLFSDSYTVVDATEDLSNGPPRTAAETRPRNLAMMYCIRY